MSYYIKIHVAYVHQDMTTIHLGNQLMRWNIYTPEKECEQQKTVCRESDGDRDVRMKGEAHKCTIQETF